MFSDKQKLRYFIANISVLKKTQLGEFFRQREKDPRREYRLRKEYGAVVG